MYKVLQLPFTMQFGEYKKRSFHSLPKDKLPNMRFSILALAASLAVCLAIPTDRYVLHEKRDGPPHQWTKRSRAHADEVLPVRIGLAQRNLHRAEEFMLDVSDPRSPNFGQFVKQLQETY